MWAPKFGRLLKEFLEIESMVLMAARLASNPVGDLTGSAMRVFMGATVGTL